MPAETSHPSVQWPRLIPEEKRDRLLLGWAILLSFGATVMVVGMVYAGSRPGNLLPLMVLAGAAVLAERQSISLSATTQVTVGSLIFIFAAVTLGPLPAIVVSAVGLLVTFGRPYTRWVVWTSSRALVAGSVGLTCVALGAVTTNSLGILFGAVALASFVEVVLDLGLGSIAPAIRGTASVTDLLKALGPLHIASIPLYAPVLALVAFAYREISPWSALLFVIPAFAAQRLFLLYREQRRTAEELGVMVERLERANLSFATALVTTLDARDQYTAGHSAAVAIYAQDIAARMGLSETDQQFAHVAGLVHDIGKIGLPPGLLEKPGAYTLEERRAMERHSEIGERILAKLDDYSEIAAIVRHHHERFDGNGYPDGISGDEIPLISRIIAVADAYNAMTSDRPYREAMPTRVARLRLAQAVETQFDTSVVAAFEAILAGASESYRLGTRADFQFDGQAQALGPAAPVFTPDVLVPRVALRSISA
ncbi:MAG: HD domain-containing phosphohydrolase [Gaiellaceae bacterium]